MVISQTSGVLQQSEFNAMTFGTRLRIPVQPMLLITVDTNLYQCIYSVHFAGSH